MLDRDKNTTSAIAWVALGFILSFPKAYFIDGIVVTWFVCMFVRIRWFIGSLSFLFVSQVGEIEM